MIEIDEAFRRLAAAPFRRQFRLVGRERAYVETWGIPSDQENTFPQSAATPTLILSFQIGLSDGQ